MLYMTTEELEILLRKYYEGRCTPGETTFVNALLDRYVEGKPFKLSTEEEEDVLSIVRQRIKDLTGLSVDDDPGNVVVEKRRPLILRRYWWGAAAAAIILFMGAYFYFQREAPIPRQISAKPPEIADVRPGTTSASLLLASGQRINLDSSQAGNIKNIQVKEGGVSLLGKDGQQVDIHRSAGLNVYNSLVTGRGQQAPQITLSDGTRVWLNAASVLRFPVQFTGNTREVTLTGEAYFEVAKDARHPFIVNTGKNNIKVLGTHFDVMAYGDEPCTYATLLEGSILINNENGSARLIPGQQGVIGGNGKIKVENVDADRAVAWLHGKLPMDNMDVHAFLREVSRWYDVDIVYKDQVPPQSFSGNLQRNVSVDHILSALQANGVKCELKGKTITISK